MKNIMKQFLIPLLGVFVTVSVGLAFPLSAQGAEKTFFPIADSYVDSTTPNANLGSQGLLIVQANKSAESKKRIFLRFNLSSIPSNAVVSSAKLKLFLQETNTSNRTYGAYRIIQDWQEGTITWNNQPTVAGTSVTTNSGNIVNTQLIWDVTADVQNFVSGSENNFGWSIRDVQEITGSRLYSQFFSKEIVTDNSAHYPQLLVVYNTPPILNSIGNKSVNEGETLSFTISGSDPDNDPLTFSAQNLPSGATFDPATKTFSWTPGFDQAGDYQVTFKVSDGELEASETITITVNDVDITSPSVSITSSDTILTEVDTGITLHIVVTFSEAMDTNAIPLISFDPDVINSGTLTFINGEWLENGTVYTASYLVADKDETISAVNVSVSGAKDTKGNTQLPNPTTANALFSIDMVKPSVVSLIPSNNATNVEKNTPLVITFSEPITPEFESGIHFTSSPDPGGWLATWSNNNQTVTLNHADYSFDSSVTITFVSSAIKDTAGNQLGQPGTWSFKIKGAPVQQSSGSGGGGGGGGGILSLPTPTPTTTPPTSTPSQPSPVTTPKPGATPVLFTRTLSLGMSGDDVRALQKFLAQDKEIYPEGLITGYFGPLTEKAVSKFQDRYGLKITGSVDFDTLNKIKEFISKSEPLQRIKIRLEVR